MVYGFTREENTYSAWLCSGRIWKPFNKSKIRACDKEYNLALAQD